MCIVATGCSGGSTASGPIPSSASVSTSAPASNTATGAVPTATSVPSSVPSSPAPTMAATPVASAAPDEALKVGVWVKQPNSTASSSQQIAALETQIGRTFDLSLHYDSWTATFPSADESNDLVHGRIPEVSWQCGASDAKVASGATDAVILARARQMAAYGAPIVLRFRWEFNLTDATTGRTQCADPSPDASGYPDPSDFVAAWVHIHDVFAAAGARNVLFEWNPSASKMDATPYWPGDAYVDWIGIDAYDLDGLGFDATFGALYAEYARVGAIPHPMAIGETGALSDQATFLDGTSRAMLAATYPLIAAVSYFDAAGPRADWTFTPQGLASFTAFANPAAVARDRTRVARRR